MASRSEYECESASLCVSECVRLEGRGHPEFLELSLPLSPCPQVCLFLLPREKSPFWSSE